MHDSAPDPTVVLAVPRTTGTAGGDLIAWGLARALADAIGDDVILRDEGTRLIVDTRVTSDELDDVLAAPESVAGARLSWLASEKKPAPIGVPTVQWEDLKQAVA